MKSILELKECFVVLERIDVTPYRTIQDIHVIEENTRTEEHVNANVLNSMDIDYEDDSEDETAAAELVLYGACYLLTKHRASSKNRKKPRNVWVREWLEQRQREGAYHKLLVELQRGDNAEQRLYHDFLRMTHENFHH